MVLISAGGQVGWAGKLAELARIGGQEMHLDLIPLNTELIDDAQSHWMFQDDVVDGFQICHSRTGVLQKETILVDDQTLIIDTENVIGQIKSAIARLTNRIEG